MRETMNVSAVMASQISTDYLIAMIGRAGGNLLAPASTEMLALCDHLCADSRRPLRDHDCARREGIARS